MHLRAISSACDVLINHNSQILLVFSFCIFCIACSGNGDLRENPFAKINTKEVKHSNGLIVRIPETANANQISSGFLIVPPLSRGMSAMKINLNPDQKSLSQNRIREKTIRGRVIQYQIEKNESEGSSGDSYAITAQEQVKSGWLIYQQSDLSELSEPSFAFFWLIVEQTNVQSNKN